MVRYYFTAIVINIVIACFQLPYLLSDLYDKENLIQSEVMSIRNSILHSLLLIIDIYMTTFSIYGAFYILLMF
jgi:hypothetical protein